MMHPHAVAAIRAAKNLHIWGRYATLRFLKIRNVPMCLFTTARVLEHARKLETNHG